jgi:hypothetical protein
MQLDYAEPGKFVWSKFGTEAGERVEAILARKERERAANGGIFLWGIGNNVGHSIAVLTKDRTPEVLFSPISSAPRICDELPSEVLLWTKAETLGGEHFDIPSGSVVTSRGGAQKKWHYALVCRSDRPLRLENGGGKIFSGALRNLVSGRQVGSSQVTSVVERHVKKPIGRAYDVLMRFRLVYPYFVRLSIPLSLPEGVSESLTSATQHASTLREIAGHFATAA